MPKPAHAKNALHYVYVVSTGQKYKTWEEAAAVLKSLPAGGRKFDAVFEGDNVYTGEYESMARTLQGHIRNTLRTNALRGDTYARQFLAENEI